MVIHARNFVTSDDALGGSVIERSLRFNTTDQTILTKTLSTSPTNRKKTTLSFWFKKSKLSTGQGVITSGASGTGGSASGTRIHFNSNDTIKVATQVNNSTVWVIDTNRKFRDPSAWMHFFMSLDTTQSTASDRVKIYFNGVQETSFSSASYPNQDYDDIWAYGNYRIGDYGGDYGYYIGYQSYLAEIITVDGQALDPSYFGYTESQTGLWRPKRYEGTYGTNGFYLDFSDNSSTAALGIDKSPNGNDFTANNFSVSAGDGNDSVTDTPTFTKATLNAITGWTNNATLKNGNLEMTGSDGFKEISTIAVDGTSKFYYESVRTISAGWQYLGIWIGQPNNPSNALSNTAIYAFASTEATSQGGVYSGSGSLSWGQDDVMGLKYENGTLKIYKNGTLHGNALTGIPTNDKVYAYIANDNTNAASFVRFNADSWTQDSAAGVDDSWELSIKNLPPNVPSIIRPQKHFETLLYTGNGGTQSITGLEFQPDLVWMKSRSVQSDNAIVDSVRGRSKIFYPSTNQQENTSASDRDLVSFDTNGFTLGAHDHTQSTNANGVTIAAWCWKAGGAAVSNNDGSITSQVSANTEAGFSIVSWTGNATNPSTIGHGLSKAPDVILVKNRSSGGTNWIMYHSANTDEPETDYLILDSTTATTDSANVWADTAPTSSVFTVGSAGSVNNSGASFITYCWHEVPGYSKFGSYTGNGSSDGTYVHLGFRPAWIMTKRTDGGIQNWLIHDIKRDPHNVANKKLAPNLDYEENNSSYIGNSSNDIIDIISNGFKMRSGNNHTNINGGTFIYMAFAEQPGTTPFETFPNAR